MEKTKKLLGIVWVAMGLFAAWYLIKEQAIPKFEKGGAENTIPAIIYTFILSPIILGAMAVFGYYCICGEYEEENE